MSKANKTERLTWQQLELVYRQLTGCSEFMLAIYRCEGLGATLAAIQDGRRAEALRLMREQQWRWAGSKEPAVNAYRAMRRAIGKKQRSKAGSV